MKLNLVLAATALASIALCVQPTAAQGGDNDGGDGGDDGGDDGGYEGKQLHLRRLAEATAVEPEGVPWTTADEAAAMDKLGEEYHYRRDDRRDRRRDYRGDYRDDRRDRRRDYRRDYRRGRFGEANDDGGDSIAPESFDVQGENWHRGGRRDYRGGGRYWE